MNLIKLIYTCGKYFSQTYSVIFQLSNGQKSQIEYQFII